MSDMPIPTKPVTETMAFHVEEVAGRTLMMLWFIFASWGQVNNILSILASGAAGYMVVLELSKALLMVIFGGLAVVLTILRRPAYGVARGIEPRVSAFLGSFLVIGIPLLPAHDVGPFWSAVAMVVMVAGTLLSLWCLAWLGRSYSIMATARKLVVAGPYAVVRHPLYACEMLAVLGIIIATFSVWSVLIGLVTCFFLYRRMLHEERVLTDAFPEYADYARLVPRIVPNFGRLTLKSV